MNGWMMVGLCISESENILFVKIRGNFRSLDIFFFVQGSWFLCLFGSQCSFSFCMRRSRSGSKDCVEEGSRPICF